MRFGRNELFFILLIIAGFVCGPWIIENVPPAWLNAFSIAASVLNAVLVLVIFVKLLADWKTRHSKQKEEQNVLDNHKD